MITAYYRPKTLEEALNLLSTPNTRPMGGGTVLTHLSNDETFAVVDLQAIDLNRLYKSDNNLKIGATVTLQTLLKSLHSPKALKDAIKLEAPLNMRNMGTVAGTLVTCDGRSPFAAAMLALDAKVTFLPDDVHVTLGNYLPYGVEGDSNTKKHSTPFGKLIASIEIPMQAKLSFRTVARSPQDRPIVCVALAQWPSGRTRLVVGGWGPFPSLAMDGNDPSGLQFAARNAAKDASDEWASAEYRSDVAAELAKRCLEE
jgi:CO/xanthine dehydrogenase FAD-binding subunit